MNARVRRGAAALAVLLVLFLSGCSYIADQQQLARGLGAEGYTKVAVGLASRNGYDTLTVSTAARPELGRDEALEGVARIVWDTYPAHFDDLILRVGDYAGELDHAGLVARYGPRRAGLDDRNLGSGLAAIGIVVLVVFVVGAVLVVLLVIWLVRRSRRRATVPPWPPRPPYGGPPGWPPGPPPAGLSGPPPR